MSASDESNAGSGMNDVRDAAFLSVGRGVAYAGFAILTLMLSLSFDPVMALKSGGVLQLLLFAGLMLKAQRIHARDYRHTETWSLLDRAKRPDERFAGRVVVDALREACHCFARWTAGAAVATWVAAILLRLMGVGGPVV